MKSLDLSKFKKASSGENQTVFEHPDGHKIFISHKGLKPGQRKDLSKLTEPQHLADGGKVADTDAYKARTAGVSKGAEAGGPSLMQGWNNIKNEFSGSASKPTAEKPQHYAAGGSVMPDSLNPQAPEQAYPMPTQLQLSPEQQYQAPMAPQDMASYVLDHKAFMSPERQAADKVADAKQAADDAPEDYSNFKMQPSAGASQDMPQMPQMPQQPGMGGLRAGIMGEANAMGKMGGEQADAGRQFQHDMERNQFDSSMHEQSIMNERAALKHDLDNEHIDPDHYIGSMGTGGKIATAIGLMLGGIGAGLTGKENPAGKFLEQQIDRDMQAQKANLSKKEGLYHANMEEMRDSRAADNMTRIQLNDMYSHKIASIAAKYQDPLAKARAQQMIGQLDAQSQQLGAQTAQTQAIKQGVASGAVPPEQAVQYLVPKEHQKDVFHSIDQAQNAAKAETKMMDYFAQAKQENTVMRTGAGLARTPGSILNMRALFLPLIHDAEGRVNEFEQKTTSDLEPKPGDTDAKIKEKLNGMRAFLQQKKAASTAKGFGIDVEKLYAPKDQGFTKRGP